MELQDAIRATGKSLRALANEAGIHHTTLIHYLRGDWVPKPEAASALGDAIGWSGRRVRDAVRKLRDERVRKARLGVSETQQGVEREVG